MLNQSRTATGKPYKNAPHTIRARIRVFIPETSFTVEIAEKHQPQRTWFALSGFQVGGKPEIICSSANLESAVR